jgi:outer membrane protein
MLLAALAVAAPMSGAELKIAVIDMDHAFQNYYRTKIVDAKLKEQKDVYTSYLNQLNESAKKLHQRFLELRDESQNIALSETVRESNRLEAQKKYTEYQAKRLEMEQYVKERGKQLNELENKQREEIVKDISEEVKRRAALDGYTLVLDRSGRTTNNISPVIYFQNSLDITETVLRDLNRGASGGK